MKWARIENGAVVEILERDPQDLFNPRLEFAECADLVRCGWLYSNGEFMPPPSADALLEPEKMNAAQKEEMYKNFAKAAIADGYSLTDEIKILRRSLAALAESGENTDEFDEYNEYVERCIEGAFSAVYSKKE